MCDIEYSPGTGKDLTGNTMLNPYLAAENKEFEGLGRPHGGLNRGQSIIGINKKEMTAGGRRFWKPGNCREGSN